jgi:hypothetical protein
VSIGEPSDRYRRLAEALLQRLYPLSRIEVRLGALPADWPARVTVPEGSSVVGSVTHRRDATLASMNVYLEGGRSEDEVLRHYEDVLGTDGWTRFTPQAPPGMGGGFRSAFASPSSRVFVRREDDPFYSVAITGAAGSIAVVAAWDAGLDHHPLRQRVGPYGPGGPLARLIPVLDAPTDVPVQGGGGGGSENEWEIRARAHTTMPVAGLAAHYREQLLRAGWTERDEGGDPVVSWSRWKLREDDYEAMLVIAEPLADVRDLALIIRSPSRAARGWKMYSGSNIRLFG